MTTSKHIWAEMLDDEMIEHAEADLIAARDDAADAARDRRMMEDM